jgi:hypothetical protein
MLVRVALVGVCGILAAPMARAQTDFVVTRNGDRLTGEVKSLDRGKLRFETDATDTIEIKWEHVAELVAEQTFEVILTDGRTLFGTLLDGAEPFEVRLSGGGIVSALPMVSVVRMTPIEGRLIERIDMRVDVGYSLTKANDSAQSNLGYDFQYRDQLRLVSLNADGATTTSESDPPSTRINTVATFRRFLAGRSWDPLGLMQIERNDELGIEQRTTFGGGMSRWLKDTNQNRMSFIGGVVYGTEDAEGLVDAEWTAEALLGFGMDWFRFDSPELDVSTRLTVYERITGASRTRGNLDVDFRWELFGDSFYSFSIYYSFDSDPESATSSKRDYGIVTSLGWEF